MMSASCSRRCLLACSRTSVAMFQRAKSPMLIPSSSTKSKISGFCWKRASATGSLNDSTTSSLVFFFSLADSLSAPALSPRNPVVRRGAALSAPVTTSGLPSSRCTDAIARATARLPAVRWRSRILLAAGVMARRGVPRWASRNTRSAAGRMASAGAGTRQSSQAVGPGSTPVRAWIRRGHQAARPSGAAFPCPSRPRVPARRGRRRRGRRSCPRSRPRCGSG